MGGMETSEQATSASRPRSHWPYVVAAIGLAALGLAAYLIHQARSLPRELMEEGRSIASDLKSVAAAFRTGTITTSFVSYATEMSGSHYLQFATLKEMEVFERTDRAALLWGQLELPDVVVRAEAPVEYTYYLDLDARWELTLEGQSVIVRAPAIRFNTPAIDVSEIRYEVKSGSVLRNEERALENLKRGLTGLSKRRAEENVALVRELGRKKTEEFVRTWLLSKYEDASSYRVEVLFPGEGEAGDENPPERPLTTR
jgi:hypothetical protein